MARPIIHSLPKFESIESGMMLTQTNLDPFRCIVLVLVKSLGTTTSSVDTVSTVKILDCDSLDTYYLNIPSTDYFNHVITVSTDMGACAVDVGDTTYSVILYILTHMQYKGQYLSAHPRLAVIQSHIS